MTGTLSEVDGNVSNVQNQVNGLADQINGLGKLISATSGMTQSQKNQLRNAAKAKNNEKLLKSIQSDLDQLDTLAQKLAQLDNKVESNNGELVKMTAAITTSGHDTVTNINDSIDRAVTALSAKIDSVEGTDLSNVESSLSTLTAKVDALNGSGSGGGGDTDLSGLVSTLSALNDTLKRGSTTSPSGSSCDSSFSCSGNAYECFLAKQAFENRCSNSLKDVLGSDDADSTLTSLNESLQGSLDGLSNTLTSTAIAAGDGRQLYSESVDIAPYLSTYNEESGGLSFDDQCPEPIPLNFLLAGVQGVDLELSFEWLCELALYVRAMLMLGASMIAGRLWFQNY